MRTSILVALVSAALAGFAIAPAGAETLNFKADLSGANEVPPSNVAGTGLVTVTFDTATKAITWKGSYSNLTGPASAVHIHAGEAGKNGGIAVLLANEKTPFEGTATLTEAQATELVAGRMYVNVHTNANKAGEIRGQLVK